MNREFWLFLLGIGLLLFNWPFLEIFSLSLPYYLFGSWSFFILIIYFAVSSEEKKGRNKDV